MKTDAHKITLLLLRVSEKDRKSKHPPTRTHTCLQDSDEENDGDDMMDGGDDDDDSENVDSNKENGGKVDAARKNKNGSKATKSEEGKGRNKWSEDHVQEESGDDGEEADSSAQQASGEASGGAAMDIDGAQGDEEADEADTGRLFVRNLPFGVTEDDLRKTFGKFGELSEVHLCVNKETKKPNGLAFILYLMPQDAVQARAKLDGKFFQGRLLHIIPAKLPTKADEEAQGGDGGPGGYKKERDKKLKEKAGSSHNWNMLFMRADTVADAAAAAHDMTKADLLDADAESMAVRLALAETHVIEQTKQQLRDEGVNIAAFTVETKPKERSRTVMLVKNLPYSVQAPEVSELFARFGEVGRVVLPQTKTMAIVEMVHENDAKKAFRQLAYSRFKQQPLYLEWGPVDTFLEDAPPPREQDSDAKSKSDAGVAGKKRGVPADEKPHRNDADDDSGAVAGGNTLYVKNLSFETSEQTLRKAVIKACGASVVRAVKIVTKPGKGKDGKDKTLSMGYAFVELATPEDAVKCLNKVRSLEVDGRHLTAEVSSRAATDSKTASVKAKPGVANKDVSKADAAGEKKGSTKIVVRNVPFEATKKELKALLGTFGQLSTLRLPKKFDGAHRGFAFADFLTHQEAAAAKKALEGTHLYGRHLVIEYAEEDNSLEALRLKTARYSSLP